MSKALGFGEVAAYDPGRRGAADISFVADYVDGLDGLGSMGSVLILHKKRLTLKPLTI